MSNWWKRQKILLNWSKGQKRLIGGKSKESSFLPLLSLSSKLARCSQLRDLPIISGATPPLILSTCCCVLYHPQSQSPHCTIFYWAVLFLSSCRSLRNAICPVNQPLYQTQPFYAAAQLPQKYCEHFQSTARIVSTIFKAQQGANIWWIWVFSLSLI